MPIGDWTPQWGKFGAAQALQPHSAISELRHLDPDTDVLSVEDPMLVYYLRAVSWPEFVREVGFTNVDYDENRDVALSFASEGPYIRRASERWTLFEADQYEARLDEGPVLPIWSNKVPPTPTDAARDRGGLGFDPDGDLHAQAQAHAEVIPEKLTSVS